MNHANKIQALKNPHLNPYRLEQTKSGFYDGLNSGLETWKTVAAGCGEKRIYSFEQKMAVAKNYYNLRIAPFMENLEYLVWGKTHGLEQHMGRHWNIR